MEKKEADKIIGGYVKKLFGFARSRLNSIDEAEELSAQTVCEVYKSLLNSEEITNLDGYVYRIASNMYARYIDREKRYRSVDGIERFTDESDLLQDLINREEYGVLRREITYLSETQRNVILLYYFHDLKIREIAETMKISENTVKWHLTTSRKELKSGMEKTRAVGTLGIEPIRFCGMGHSGSPGSKGDTANFLAKSLTQNIAYAAYHQPRTVNEIAEELGINPIFVKDEVDILETYGFMDRLSGDKLRTNIRIYKPSRETSVIYREAYGKFVPIFLESFFVPILNGIMKIPDFVHIPDNDLNLYKWCMVKFLADELAVTQITDQKYAVERPDGGKYSAFAQIEVQADWEPTDEEPEKLWACGDMWRDVDQHEWLGWQFNCCWAARGDGWRGNLSSDFESLDYFLRGELPEIPANLESYRRLLEKKYLIKENGSYRCNVILCDSYKKWKDHIPSANEEILKISKEFAELATKADLIGQPKHMHDQIRYYNQNAACRLHTRIMLKLVKMGVLEIPKNETQAKTLLTILFTGK